MDNVELILRKIRTHWPREKQICDCNTRVKFTRVTLTFFKFDFWADTLLFLSLILQLFTLCRCIILLLKKAHLYNLYNLYNLYPPKPEVRQKKRPEGLQRAWNVFSFQRDWWYNIEQSLRIRLTKIWYQVQPCSLGEGCHGVQWPHLTFNLLLMSLWLLTVRSHRGV